MPQNQALSQLFSSASEWSEFIAMTGRKEGGDGGKTWRDYLAERAGAAEDRARGDGKGAKTGEREEAVKS